MNDRELEPRVRELLSEAYPEREMRFAPGFADRVMAGVRSATTPTDISTALTRQCRRVLPALLAASLALVAWNLTAKQEADSLFLSALGIRASASTSSADSLTALQGAEVFQ